MDDEKVVEVGVLHYKGDVRQAQMLAFDSPRYGVVVPHYSEYDEDADRTTIHFVGLVGGGDLG